MVIEVDPRPLVKLFTDFIGNSKVMFNFKTDGRKLDVQVLDDYTVTTSIPVSSVDGDFVTTDISVWISKFIHVMKKDEKVHMTINDAVLFIESGSFNCTLLREYESSRELPNIDGVELKNAGASRLKYLAHAAVSCSCMSKELSISDPDPVFVGGRMYLNYNQAAFIDKMDYPQLCIPYSTLRGFAFRLNEKAVYAYLKEYDVLYFKSAEYEFWVPVTNYNINQNVINVLDKKLTMATDVTTVTFASYKEQLMVLASAFPKQKVALSFGNRTFQVMANTNITNVCAGYQLSEILASTAITTAQLTAIIKIFGDDESVAVKKGVGCLCLVSGAKTVMIAETVY